MFGELDAFVSDEREPASPERVGDDRVVLEVLVFEYGGDAYAVPARSVEGVVPWKEPTPVPGVDARLRGVVQDRGRVVAVLNHPTGRAVPNGEEPRRLILCNTPEGLVGLPASVTRAVGSSAYPGEPKPLAVYDGTTGAHTFIAPARLHGALDDGAAAGAKNLEHSEH